MFHQQKTRLNKKHSDSSCT